MAGLYVAVKYTENSLQDLKANLLDRYNIPNQISLDKIHTTIIYSKTFDSIKTAEYMITKPIAEIASFEVWKTQDGNSALVAKLDAPELVSRHNDLMSNHNLTYDYDEYNPHITLSYNVPSDYIPPKDIPNIVLIIDKEYQEELIENWAKDNE